MICFQIFRTTPSDPSTEKGVIRFTQAPFLFTMKMMASHCLTAQKDLNKGLEEVAQKKRDAEEVKAGRDESWKVGSILNGVRQMVGRS